MAIDNRCGERKGHTGPCKPKRVHGPGIGEALEMADTAFICQKVLVNTVLRQACPECENGEGLAGVGAVIHKAPTAECWRCDNHGLVEPYDNDAPTIIVHVKV